MDLRRKGCKIAAMKWDDLSFLLAAMRGGSLAQAARLKRVDKTTVSRRLSALEQSLNVALVSRDARGGLVLTEQGRDVALQAEAMEDQARRIRASTSGAQALPRSWVRVTAVPLIVNRLLLPHLPDLTARHPDIAVELVADARDLSMAHGDADIALRLARPRDGGQAVLAHRLGQIDYAAYGASKAVGPQPWIGFDRTMQYLAPAAAIAAAADQPGQSRAPLAVNDAETLYQAVLAGQGKSLLPRVIADADPRLSEVAVACALPTREIWMLVGRDVRAARRAQVVMDWLRAVFDTARSVADHSPS